MPGLVSCPVRMINSQKSGIDYKASLNRIIFITSYIILAGCHKCGDINNPLWASTYEMQKALLWTLLI